MTIYNYSHYSYLPDNGYPISVYPNPDPLNSIYPIHSEDNLTDTYTPSHLSDLSDSNSFHSDPDSAYLDPIYSSPVTDPDLPSENLNNDHTHSPSSDHSIQQAYEHTTVKSRYWSEIEIQKLKELRKKYGRDWNIIASKLKSKTTKQCSDKWQRGIWPKMSEKERLEYMHRWSCEEDTQMMDLVKSYGTRWGDIAPFFLNKTENACSLRWYNIILPQIPEEDRYEYESERISWTNEEKERLSELVSLHGINDWKKISLLIRKSPTACELQWNYMNIDVSRNSKPIIWTQELEEKLLTTANECRRMNGTYRWKEISIKLGGIKIKACESKLHRLNRMQDPMKIPTKLLSKASTNMKKIRRKKR